MYAELRYLAVLYVYWVTVPQLHHLFFNWYSLRCDQAVVDSSIRRARGHFLPKAPHLLLLRD